MTAYTLLNGEFTSDPRLDRVRRVDLRSLNYVATPESLDITAEEAREPRSYTWRLETNLDQGREGACVGFGFAHELAARPGVVTGVDGTYAREEVYWEAQRRDPWEGGAYPGAEPFYEGSSVLAGAQVVHGLGLIREYRWALTLEQLITALGYHGPVVIGVDWYTDMFWPDQEGFIHPTGQIAGGHCVCLPGQRIVRAADGSVDMLASYVVVHNSWGPSWGATIKDVPGRAKLALIDLAVLWPGGDFCVPVGRVKADVADAG